MSESEGLWGFLAEGLILLFLFDIVVLVLFVWWWKGAEERWDEFFEEINV